MIWLGLSSNSAVYFNYRGITPLSVPGNVYSGGLERRIRLIVELPIQGEQSNFHPGRGTQDQLFSFAKVLGVCPTSPQDVPLGVVW